MNYLACAAILALFTVAWIEWRRRAYARRLADDAATNETVSWLKSMREEEE